jgi:hypothetical protein
MRAPRRMRGMIKVRENFIGKGNMVGEGGIPN